VPHNFAYSDEGEISMRMAVRHAPGSDDAKSLAQTGKPKQMKNTPNQQQRSTTRLRTLCVAALALGCAFIMVPGAGAQSLTPPATPTGITPPEGNSLFLLGHAQGTQGYICLPTGTGASTASWTVKGARPEATLFQTIFGQTFQIITHFLSPDTNPNGVAPNPLPFGSATWQSSLDSSKVWAAVLDPKKNVVQAGSDASCPNTGSIACLLLTSIGSEQGPSGGTILSKTTFVQRLNTAGGSAPEDGCSTSADVGNQVLVPYTADYLFYKKQ
jgi:hypothetical protein